jgi:hypothetical protein
MKNLRTIISLNSLILFLLLSLNVDAKKIVCIDDGGDAFLNAHEGWERQNADDDTVIQVGGSLADCLAQLANGDQLVIVAHGFNGGEGFIWGGQHYYGFGDGEDEMPVPEGFDELTGIKVDFCSCWSNKDPDGADGDDTSLCSKIKDALGTGATAKGFTDLATTQACYKLIKADGAEPTKAEIKAAEDCLNNDPSWTQEPPYNRDPSPETNDQTAAQALIDGKIGAGKIIVSVFYYKPKNTKPEEEEESVGGVYVGCDCGDGCGLHFYMNYSQLLLPGISVDNPTVLPEGLWINPTPWNFINLDPVNGEVMSLQNVRMFNVGPPMPLFDPGSEPFFVDSFFDIFFDIYLGGELVADEVQGNGNMQTMVIPTPFSDPLGAQYFDLEIIEMTMGGVSPFGPIQIQPNPGAGPGTGLLSVLPSPDGFTVDSFFDIAYTISLGTEGGQSCGQASLVYQCQVPGIGCTEQGAANYNSCAAFDDGSCQGSAAGCTYIGAANYDPLATIEDGSCVFIGCTDPTAVNYNPFATHDNGSCSYAVPCLGDMNGDGVRDTTDLLMFLGVFGQACIDVAQ